MSSLPATKLGSAAIIEAVKQANIEPKDVQEVYMGNVCIAASGQAPARQAALGAGVLLIPHPSFPEKVYNSPFSSKEHNAL